MCAVVQVLEFPNILNGRVSCTWSPGSCLITLSDLALGRKSSRGLLDYLISLCCQEVGSACWTDSYLLPSSQTADLPAEF